MPEPRLNYQNSFSWLHKSQTFSKLCILFLILNSYIFKYRFTHWNVVLAYYISASIYYVFYHLLSLKTVRKYTRRR